MAARRNADPSAWMPTFLATLREATVKRAAEIAGIGPALAYYYRSRDPAFAAKWQAALAEAPDSPVVPQRTAGWRTAFLDALIETSNVAASAMRAGVPLRTAYKTRRDDAGFAARWRAALHEGYDNLEFELLGHLRDPAPTRKMDVTAALRLLVAHRETVARERALREDDDEQAVLESIDRFIDDMRQRRMANNAILIETERDDGAA